MPPFFVGRFLLYTYNKLHSMQRVSLPLGEGASARFELMQSRCCKCHQQGLTVVEISSVTLSPNRYFCFPIIRYRNTFIIDPPFLANWSRATIQFCYATPQTARIDGASKDTYDLEFIFPWHRIFFKSFEEKVVLLAAARRLDYIKNVCV